jgi:hypothetical protein
MNLQANDKETSCTIGTPGPLYQDLPAIVHTQRERVGQRVCRFADLSVLFCAAMLEDSYGN